MTKVKQCESCKAEIPDDADKCKQCQIMESTTTNALISGIIAFVVACCSKA